MFTNIVPFNFCFDKTDFLFDLLCNFIEFSKLPFKSRSRQSSAKFTSLLWWLKLRNPPSDIYGSYYTDQLFYFNGSYDFTMFSFFVRCLTAATVQWDTRVHCFAYSAVAGISKHSLRDRLAWNFTYAHTEDMWHSLLISFSQNSTFHSGFWNGNQMHENSHR